MRIKEWYSWHFPELAKNSLIVYLNLEKNCIRKAETLSNIKDL